MAHNARNKNKYNKKRTTLTIHNISTISSPKQKLHRKSPITKPAHTFNYISYRNAPECITHSGQSHDWYELNKTISLKEQRCPLDSQKYSQRKYNHNTSYIIVTHNAIIQNSCRVRTVVPHTFQDRRVVSFNVVIVAPNQNKTN